MELYPSVLSSYQKENFVNTSKRLLENGNWLFPVVHYFTWKVEFFSNILSMLVVQWKMFLVWLWFDNNCIGTCIEINFQTVVLIDFISWKDVYSWFLSFVFVFISFLKFKMDHQEGDDYILDFKKGGGGVCFLIVIGKGRKGVGEMERKYLDVIYLWSQ